MENIKVIVADDNRYIIDEIEYILSKLDDIEIIGIANNGHDEYSLILELNPDLVITDNQMPWMKGIDVINVINKSEMKNKPTFIMVTSDSDYEFINNAYRLGVFKVLNKPIQKEDLITAIEEYKILKS